MPTYQSSQSSESIVQAISGARYLLFEGGGRTGDLDLHGSARFDYINSSGLAVQNTLNVTGNQANFGNFTGFNFNHLARIVCTGDAYINNITGNLKIGGNVDLNNNLRVTGQVNITGSLFVNGIQITGNGVGGSSTGFLTGNFASLYNNRGDLLVGTGVGLFDVFTTGGAISGQHLIYDPSLNIPFRWASGTSSSAGLTEFSETRSSTNAILKPTGANFGLMFLRNGSSNIFIGQTGSNGNNAGSSNIYLGQNHGGNGSLNTVAGLENLASGVYQFVIGNGAVAETTCEFTQGINAFSAMGACQTSVYVNGVTTNDSTPTTILSIPIKQNVCASIDALITAFQVDGSVSQDQSAGYKLAGVFKQYDLGGGTVNQVGSTDLTILGEDDASWNVYFQTNVNSVDIIVVGDDTSPTRWAIRAESIKIGF